MYKCCGYCFGSGVVESGTDSPEVVNVPIAGFAGSGDLIVECKVRVQEETKVTCRWSGFYDCGWVDFQCGIVEFGQLISIAEN